MTEIDEFRRYLIVLVGDLADEFLDQILQSDQARDPPVLVDHQTHVHGVALHLLQERLRAHRLGDEGRRAGDRPDRRRAPRTVVAVRELHEILEVQHSYDVVGIVIDDGHPGHTAVQEERHRLVRVAVASTVTISVRGTITARTN